jgi:hypothetical protein
LSFQNGIPEFLSLDGPATSAFPLVPIMLLAEKEEI